MGNQNLRQNPDFDWIYAQLLIRQILKQTTRGRPRQAASGLPFAITRPLIAKVPLLLDAISHLFGDIDLQRDVTL